MGINTVSGRISDCNMYHWGIYLQCEGRGGCFISQDSNGKHDVLQPRVVKAGRGTGKKPSTINQRVKESFRADVCRMHHHQPWEKAERRNGWIKSLGQPRPVLLLPFSLWLCSVIWSRAADWTKLRVILRCPCSLPGFFVAFGLGMPLTRIICNHLTALPLSDSLTGCADGPEAGRHPEHAPGSAGGSGTDARASHPTCQTSAEKPRVPPSEAGNVKSSAQPHATLSLFHARVFLSLGVFSCVTGEMKYSAVVD